MKPNDVIGCLVLWLLISYSVRFVYRGITEPSADPETRRYMDLCKAMRSPTFDEINAAAKQIQRDTTDEEMRTAARLIVSSSQLSLDAGVHNTADAEGATGFINGLVAGIWNLRFSFRSWGVLIDSWWNSNIFQSLDGRYRPRLLQFVSDDESSKRAANWAFGLVWIGGSFFSLLQKTADSKRAHGESPGSVPA